MSSNKRQIKIALLLCDTPIPTVLSTHGTYVDIFRNLLQASLPPSAEVDFTLDGFDVVVAQDYPDLGEDEDSTGDYDGVLITGSGGRKPLLE